MEKKLGTPITFLCQGVSEEFFQFLAYCRNLRFDEAPDYLYARNLFRVKIQQSGFVGEVTFDWAKLSHSTVDMAGNE